MFKFIAIKRMLLISFSLVIILCANNICSLGAESIEKSISTPITKVYPTRVALALCKYLSDSISLNDDTTSRAYKTLREFNEAVRNILTNPENKEIWIKEFHTIFPEVLTTLRTISEDSSFNESSKHISATIASDLKKLFEKTNNLSDTEEMKTLLQTEAPIIAVKEFLDRNINIKQRTTKCEDCGLGYFRQLKRAKGKLTLECQLCHHHQNSDLKLSVVNFLQPSSNREFSTPGSKIKE